MRRLHTMVAGSLALAAGLIAASAVPASAHAIIDLGGVSAVAGKASAMTLEIQHGCLPVEATTQVEAFVGPRWRAVEPVETTGWQASVERTAHGGWHITWIDLGEPIAFAKPTFFRIKVSWPDKPGIYGMRVTQQCTDGASYDWNAKSTPATAHRPSPPLTPRPEVLVVAHGEAMDVQSRPDAPSTPEGHAH